MDIILVIQWTIKVFITLYLWLQACRMRIAVCMMKLTCTGSLFKKSSSFVSSFCCPYLQPRNTLKKLVCLTLTHGAAYKNSVVLGHPHFPRPTNIPEIKHLGHMEHSQNLKHLNDLDDNDTMPEIGM